MKPERVILQNEKAWCILGKLKCRGESICIDGNNILFTFQNLMSNSLPLSQANSVYCIVSRISKIINHFKMFHSKSISLGVSTWRKI